MNVEVSLVELLSCFWNCITEHGGYVCYDEDLNILRSNMQMLSHLRNHLNTKVETADRVNEMIHKLEHWFSKVEVVETNATELVNQGSQELESNCLGSCCPRNCWSRHKIGRKIQSTLTDVAALNTEGEQLLATPIEGTLDKLRSCLGKDGVGRVGIYGKGGVGKTTVMNEFGSNLLSEANLTTSWKDKGPEERAKDICEVLSRKRFLLLLDDIWEPVDLTKVGFPIPDRDNGSKIIFTTRTEEVCNQMGAEEKIEVDRLTEKKAWAFFREKAGKDTLDIPEIRKPAETIAKMCDGLPLALLTVGQAMELKKTFQEWDHSNKTLRKSVSEFSGTKDPVFALLNFSYDNLPSETIKSCFLYCTLFPEEFSINKFNLIDCWIGEGFLDEFSEGKKIIRTLVHASLLQDDGEEVKMHDLIREVALWISCECGRLREKYLVEAGAQLSEAPEIGRWERVRRMSLMSNHIQRLTKAPRCNDLLTLFLGNNHLKMIDNAFFQFMPSLKVLDLSGNRELNELPSGISKTGSLQYLNLSRTGIRQLPVALRNLVKLKCLNLEYTYELQTIPMRLIASFSNMKLLRMLHCASSDRIVGDGIQTGGHQSMLRELQQLEHLNELTISITREYSLETFRSWDKFQTCTQALSLHFKHSRSLDISFLEGMKCLDDLEFINCITLRELRIEQSLIMRGGSFNSLHKVSIINCSKLEDLTWIALAPNLVSHCIKMLQHGRDNL
ncbi:hypothetical protein GH714_034354 [Hevea brasiliensis]|uniref:Uncharacterized protein n=1 Tax=Hevea brasiliensis TaxID=3981 RepID=A0A6A6NDZ5_HEVBR|nr:hypothetical protein GH714_034354 [Hevea brasiliensis]